MIVSHEDVLKELLRLENIKIKQIELIIKPLIGILENKIMEMYNTFGSKGVIDYVEFLKYNRSIIFEEFVKNEIIKTQKQLDKSLYLGVMDAFINSFYLNYYLFEKDSETTINIPIPSEDKASEIVAVTTAGFTLSDRIKKWSDETFFRYKQILHQELSQGHEIKKALELLKLEILTYNQRIKTLFVAENTRSQSKATEYIYEKAIAKGSKFDKVWVATLDNRTRDAHRTLDGKKADKDGYFHYGAYQAKAPAMFGVPSLDINCRCTTRALFKGLEPTTRKENIGSKPIIKYKNYEDWFNERISK
jgi:hypothetical protein